MLLELVEQGTEESSTRDGERYRGALIDKATGEVIWECPCARQHKTSEEAQNCARRESGWRTFFAFWFMPRLTGEAANV